MESHAEGAPARWSVPQCPFTIEYSPRVLDDIRLAVVDAFCSMSHGGVEIGGVLLGKYGRGRLEIQDYVPLPTEHVSGPSFELSAYDHMKLSEVLATARGNPKGGQPVGWYHSHTRSGISLTAADLEIHKRYFPEPWQVALVLQPFERQPTRAGFFFREPDGAVRDSSCYQEFAMEPLAIGKIPDAVETSGESALLEAPPAAREAPNVPPPLPSLVQVAPKRSYRRQGILLASILALAMGAWAYHTRDLWLPARAAEVRYIGLNTADAEGQLQIRWDRNSVAVRQARAGAVTIQDVGNPQVVELDAAHLQAGVFTYGRKGGKVDVAMTLSLPDGQRIREATSFLGQAPVRPAAEEAAAVRREVEALTRQLEEEKVRNHKLEKSIQDARGHMQMQQRKRMGNQIR